MSDPNIHASYGLRFLINHSRDALKIMPEVLEAVLKALARIGLRDQKPLVEVPSVEDGTDEAAVAARDEALDMNSEIE